MLQKALFKLSEQLIIKNRFFGTVLIECFLSVNLLVSLSFISILYKVSFLRGVTAIAPLIQSLDATLIAGQSQLVCITIKNTNSIKFNAVRQFGLGLSARKLKLKKIMGLKQALPMNLNSSNVNSHFVSQNQIKQIQKQNLYIQNYKKLQMDSYQPQITKGKSLSSNASYRSTCHSSSGKYLAYLSGTGSQSHICVLSFNDNQITSQQQIKVREQPIFFIKIHQVGSHLWLMIGYLTKLVLNRIVGTLYQVICQNKLGLDRNIVDYTMGYVACDVWNKSQTQVLFIVVTRNCRLYFINIFSQKKDQKMEFQVNKYESLDRIISMAVVKDKIMLGDQSGNIHRINIIKSELQISIDTKSNFPILLLKNVLDQTAVAVTCQGQVILVNRQEKSFKLISVHNSAITRLHTLANQIFTFGEDCILNHFTLQNQQLKLVKAYPARKMPGLIFSINNKTYYTVYQEMIINQI